MLRIHVQRKRGRASNNCPPTKTSIDSRETLNIAASTENGSTVHLLKIKTTAVQKQPYLSGFKLGIQ